ncbi:MAG: enoyl-CoA hydratase/isomerase family protein [Planctomycetes bacterium]|nr:enoyl-CoA hydratase/isomerase family protein [Planctomycetota bacterium]
MILTQRGAWCHVTFGRVSCAFQNIAPRSVRKYVNGSRIRRKTEPLAHGRFALFSARAPENIWGMLFESAHVRVTAEYGVGTLWLAFPGAPVNALDAPRLTELSAAVAAIERDPFLNVLVVRSAKPAGFCAGLHPGAADVSDRVAFAAHGQRALARLAAVPFVTVAFIDGPCLGAGLELALACDRRVCVATPATHLGFPQRFTCFGGGPRLRQRLGRKAQALIESGHTLSGREALALGLVDRACCARRAKIELRTVLDELERRPRVPVRVPDESGFAHERTAFAQIDLTAGAASGSARALSTDALLARGFITPLEAEQMRAAASRPPAAGPSDTIRRAA